MPAVLLAVESRAVSMQEVMRIDPTKFTCFVKFTIGDVVVNPLLAAFFFVHELFLSLSLDGPLSHHLVATCLSSEHGTRMAASMNAMMPPMA